MPRVRYKYDENQPWTYVEGDSWTTEIVEARCSGTYIIPRVLFYAEQKTFGSADGWALRGAAGEFGMTFGKVEIVDKKLEVTFNGTDGSPFVRIINPDPGNEYIAIRDVELIHYWYSNRELVQLNPLEFFINGDAKCHPAGCEFRVYLGSVETFSTVALVCPIAELAPDECPPNTCSVDCGDHVCCYGSDGISVFNFSK